MPIIIMIINARGTKIEIKEDSLLLKRSKVLQTYDNTIMKNNDTDTEYYLNYRDSLVHDLIDYIEGYSKYNSKLDKIMDELMIENEVSNKINYTLKYVTRLVFWNHYNKYKPDVFCQWKFNNCRYGDCKCCYQSPIAIDFLFDKLMSDIKPIMYISKIDRCGYNSDTSHIFLLTNI